jgi:ribosomal protein S18 acetylase RimI-like enzyme
VECIFIETPTEEQIRQIIELYRSQGWWNSSDEATKKLIPRLISGSHCFVVATEGNRVVGMGRAISDGVSDAYIQDLAVLSSHRRRGIGKRILQALLQRLAADGLSWIGLIAEPGSSHLYRHAGFHEMIDWIPMLMIEEP